MLKSMNIHFNKVCIVTSTEDMNMNRLDVASVDQDMVPAVAAC